VSSATASSARPVRYRPTATTGAHSDHQHSTSPSNSGRNPTSFTHRSPVTASCPTVRNRSNPAPTTAATTVPSYPSQSSPGAGGSTLTGWTSG